MFGTHLQIGHLISDFYDFFFFFFHILVSGLLAKLIGVLANKLSHELK